MLKVLTVIGARPQFIKAAALSRAFSKKRSKIQEIIIHTGQHFDENMSHIFFKEMDIPRPDYNLNINGLSHAAMTGQMLEAVEKVILKEKPNYVLVYGDTNSTIAGALAAKKLQVKVIHVEAGLRSFNNDMPEEINRILTDRIADLLFCPTETAVDNLNNEGYRNIRCKIICSGDVMQDAALYYKSKSEYTSQVVSANGLKANGFLLCTMHRAENTDNPKRLREIVSSLNEINKDLPIVVPLHPRTRKVFQNLQIDAQFKIIEPVGYLDMIQLISRSRLILTDSGGLQKEAYFFNKYCITLRDETEWVELVNNGYNEIAGSSYSNIISAYKKLVDKKFLKDKELFGGGQAANIICEEIINFQA